MLICTKFEWIFAGKWIFAKNQAWEAWKDNLHYDSHEQNQAHQAECCYKGETSVKRKMHYKKNCGNNKLHLY